jgi:predicted nucleotidyltransferase
VDEQLENLKFGLSPRILGDMRAILHACPGVTRAFIFGSRAKGAYTEGSDIDIAVQGDKLDKVSFAQLCAQLEAIPMVFSLDIVHIETLRNALLIAAIHRDKQMLFER